MTTSKRDSKTTLVDRMREIGAKEALDKYRETAKDRSKRRINLCFAKLIGIDFANADLSDVDLIGATFAQCNFDVSTVFCRRDEGGEIIDKVQIKASMFVGMKEMKGLSFVDLDLSGCTFLNCNLDKSSFAKAILVRVEFKDSSLLKCIFLGAVLQSKKADEENKNNPYGIASFFGSLITGSNFSGAIGFDLKRVVKQAKDGENFDLLNRIQHNTVPLSIEGLAASNRGLDTGVSVSDSTILEKEKSGILRLPNPKTGDKPATSGRSNAPPLGVATGTNMTEDQMEELDRLGGEDDFNFEEVGEDFFEEISVNEEGGEEAVDKNVALEGDKESSESENKTDKRGKRSLRRKSRKKR